MVPLDKYQANYLREYRKIKSVPQERIDATYRYIEAIENGEEDISNGILIEPPKKYYKKSYEKIDKSSQPTADKKYQKPLYIRDRNNPSKIYPYKG